MQHGCNCLGNVAGILKETTHQNGERETLFEVTEVDSQVSCLLGLFFGFMFQKHPKATKHISSRCLSMVVSLLKMCESVLIHKLKAMRDLHLHLCPRCGCIAMMQFFTTLPATSFDLKATFPHPSLFPKDGAEGQNGRDIQIHAAVKMILVQRSCFAKFGDGPAKVPEAIVALQQP